MPFLIFQRQGDELLDAGYWILDAGYWMLILGTGDLEFNIDF